MTACLLWATELLDHTAGLLHLCYRTFRITPWVSYTHVPGFTPKGVNGPLLALPNTHYLYLFFYVLNHETSIGRRPKYELTTHSSTLMMNDYIHAHTPNMLMSLCIYNANVTANSHVTCMMHTTWDILINPTSCQVPCNIYRKHISSIHFMPIFIDIVVSCILSFINT